MDIIKFSVQLPVEPVAADIEGGELSLRINGEPLPPVATTKGQTVVEGLEGPQDSLVLVSFRYVDDSGNKSAATTFEAQLLDTFAPPQPGAMGIVITGETDSVVEDSVEPVDSVPELELPTVEEEDDSTVPTPEPAVVETTGEVDDSDDEAPAEVEEVEEADDSDEAPAAVEPEPEPESEPAPEPSPENAPESEPPVAAEPESEPAPESGDVSVSEEDTEEDDETAV